MRTKSRHHWTTNRIFFRIYSVRSGPRVTALITPTWSRSRCRLLNTRTKATTIELAAQMADYIDSFT